MTRDWLRQAALLVTLAFLPAIVQAVYLRDRAPWHEPAVAQDEVTLEQVNAWGASVLWVDARPDEQFEQKHVPNALSLNEDRWNEQLPQVLQTWSLDKRVVVYCSSQSCAASHEIARRLRDEAGLKNVYVLHGGWEAWLATQK